jgi:hypothetical protein
MISMSFLGSVIPKPAQFSRVRNPVAQMLFGPQSRTRRILRFAGKAATLQDDARGRNSKLSHRLIPNFDE